MPDWKLSDYRKNEIKEIALKKCGEYRLSGSKAMIAALVLKILEEQLPICVEEIKKGYIFPPPHKENENLTPAQIRKKDTGKCVISAGNNVVFTNRRA